MMYQSNDKVYNSYDAERLLICVIMNMCDSLSLLTIAVKNNAVSACRNLIYTIILCKYPTTLLTKCMQQWWDWTQI